MKWIAALALVAGCKTQGTIELDLSVGCGSGSGSSYDIVYAEPNTSCDICVCGGCAGRHTDSIVACYRCSDADLSGLPVDLAPGSWAVVVEKWDAASNQMMASDCAEVVVDADGVQGGGAPGQACVDCTATGSSSSSP